MSGLMQGKTDTLSSLAVNIKGFHPNTLTTYAYTCEPASPTYVPISGLDACLMPLYMIKRKP